MDGLQHLDDSAWALILLLLVSLLILVVTVPVAIGGAVVWLVRRFPSNKEIPPTGRFVQVCMGVALVVVVLWGAVWAVSKVFFGVDIVAVQTSGRTCRSSGMGGPVGVCEDMHLCAAVPEGMGQLMTACEGGTSGSSDCPHHSVAGVGHDRWS